MGKPTQRDILVHTHLNLRSEVQWYTNRIRLHFYAGTPKASAFLALGHDLPKLEIFRLRNYIYFAFLY